MNKHTLYRLWHTIRLYMIPSSYERARYIGRHGIFRRIGEGCSVMERKVPLYPNLIALGSNVHLASRVSFTPHDVTHAVINGMKEYSHAEATSYPKNQSGGGLCKGENRLYRNRRQCIHRVKYCSAI